jgi:quercetin dioxygenase-like cupin family protein
VTSMFKHSLDALAKTQLEAASTSATGRASRTIFGGHERVLRQTVIALRSGQSLGEHQNPGEATVHILLGRVRLVAGDNVWEGRRGDLLIVPPEPHRLDAMADSAVLLTVAKVARPGP